MKLSIQMIPLLLVFASLVAAEVVQLYALSTPNPNLITFKSLSYKHSGAALDYIFLGDGIGANFEYDSEKGLIYDPRVITGGVLGPYNVNYTLSVSPPVQGRFPFLQLSPGGHTKWLIENSKFSLVNGTGTFYAGKNVSDPYRYSDTQFAVGYSDAGLAAVKNTGYNVTALRIIAVFPDDGPYDLVQAVGV